MAVATSTVIASAALAATAVSGYQQYQAAGDAADARREGQEISGAQQQIQQRRSNRQAIREERIRRARIMQASENTGVAGSSSEMGSTAALGTLTASNIAAGRGNARAAEGLTGASQSAMDAQRQGQLWGTIGNASGAAFNASGGFNNFGLFNSAGGGQPIQGGFQSEVFTGN